MTTRWLARGRGSARCARPVEPLLSTSSRRALATELDFGQMGKAAATWELEPSGTGTKVTWGFHSPVDGIVARWFGLMFDRWIGADYEKGLQRLKLGRGALARKRVAMTAAARTS